MIITKTKLAVDIYKVTIFFYITDDPQDTYEQERKKHKEPYEKDGSIYAGLFFKSNHNYHIAINSDSVDPNTICHEIFHCGMKIASDKGVQDEEATAWLVGYISEKVFQYLHKHNIQVKYASK